MGQLRLILGDQLSASISSLQGIQPQEDIILMCEVRDEATYVPHHKKKIAFVFSAMRHFAKDLSGLGYRVDYIALDDPQNTGSLKGEVHRALQRHQLSDVVVTHPGEYRIASEMQQWGIPVEMRPDDRFLCSIVDFADWAQGRKQLRMEYFYRMLRKKYHILMDHDQPMGGQWNWDADNREPPKKGLEIPAGYQHPIDAITQDVLDLTDRYFPEHFGETQGFYFAVTRDQALTVLDDFIRNRLAHFGTYQDAMVMDEPWMYHAHISFYLNCGLLLPLECITAAVQAYDQGKAPINSVEGFVRQILGWREYVRGIYWLNMPDYAQLNYLNAQRDLPQFYWDAEVDMTCLRQCVSHTQKYAYAHHIQRLMVLGNFALLTGVAPQQVQTWFLSVYADAYEWVELPNVSGMILFADGGYLASKPYAAGGAYIKKMSDYCRHCVYQVDQKNGPKACPFNYLYWYFLEKNQEKLQSNHRMYRVYSVLNRMSAEKRQAIREDSIRFLEQLQ